MKKRSSDSPHAAEPDLLLNEESLIRLAMRELNGRLPPGYQPASRALGFLRNGTGREEGLALASHKPRTVLAHELDLRGWTIRDLAERMGVAPSEVLALTKGQARVTPDLAQKLAKAFATSDEFWL